MNDQKDSVQPSGKWVFDTEVTQVFDDMLSRSIPQYELMRQTCFDLGRRFVKPQTDIVDLGCSRGEAIAPFVEKFGAYNTYVGVDVSTPMLDSCRHRFEGWISRSLMRVEELDLRTAYPPCRASVTLCILTLQFTPIEYRHRILRQIYDHTLSGGVLILVEKVLGGTSTIDETMVELYYDLKKANGYTYDQIQRKRISLEGVLVPITAAWNEDLIRATGFRDADCFWRWCNFCGWIAIK